MKIVWSRRQPSTYSDIRRALAKHHVLGGQSVQTMLKRLVEKGVLQRQKRDVYYYAALVPRTDYVRAKTETLVETVFDGNAKGLLWTLLGCDAVTPQDLEELLAHCNRGWNRNE